MLSPKPWRAETVILLIAAVFFCLCCGALLNEGLRHARVGGFTADESPGTILIATLSFHGAVWLLLLPFCWVHHVDWRDVLGWHDPKLKAALKLALLTLVVVAPVVMALEYVSVLVLTFLKWPLEDEQAVALITNTQSLWLRVYLGFFAVVLAPVAEEFIFRGTLYPLVKQWGFPRLAWIGVSLVFALIHQSAQTFVPLFVFALALTWLYEKTDNLLAPITVHSLFNAANLVLLLLPGQANAAPPGS
jgi:membrane protease YdiL (CAAX protease family)